MRLGKTVRSVDVAQASLSALGRRSVVLPGLLTKLLRHVTFGLPRALHVHVMGKVMRKMT